MRRKFRLTIAVILSCLTLTGCVTTGSNEAQSDSILISFGHDEDECCKKCCKQHKKKTFLEAVIQAGVDAAVD